MPVSESVLRVAYSAEITSHTDWLSLTQKATEILQDEILKGGGIAPVVLANWSIDKTDRCGHPTFLLRLSDVPDDPKAAVARFSEEFIQRDADLRHVLSDLWGDFLRYRSRRQAHDINLYISGGTSGSDGGK